MGKRRSVAVVLALVAAAVAVAAAVVAPGASADPVVTPLSTSVTLHNQQLTPDRAHYLYIDGSELRSANPATGEVERTFSADLSPVPGFVISPDSQTVVFLRSSGGVEELVAAAIDGSGEVVLATGVAGEFLSFDLAPVLGRVVYERLDTSNFTSDFFSIPLDGSTAGTTVITDIALTAATALHGRHVVVGSASAPATIDAYDIVTQAHTEVITDAVLHADPLARGRLRTASDTHVLYSVFANGFATLVGASPYDMAGQPTTVRFDVNDDVAAAAQDDQVVVEQLDGLLVYLIDTSALPGISTAPQLAPDNSGVVWSQLQVPSTYLATYWAPLDPGQFAPTPVEVPGGDGIVPEDIAYAAADRIVYPGALVGGGRPYRVWTPGDVAAGTTALAPWPGIVGDPTLYSWKVTDDAGSVLVSGDRSQLVRLDLTNLSADPVVLEDTTSVVTSAVGGVEGSVLYSLVDPTTCSGQVADCLGAAHLWRDVPPPPSASMLTSPVRVMDTRPTGATVDDVSEAEGPVGSPGNDPYGNGVYRLAVGGRAGIPSDADAFVLNVAVVDPALGGFVSVYPCAAEPPSPPVPLTASLNFRPGVNAVANNAIVGQVAGYVCIYTSRVVHVVVDVMGWFPAGADFDPATAPMRLVDTRPGADVVAGGISGGGNAQALDVFVVPVAGVGEVPVDAEAVAVNLAAVHPVAGGFATLWPCDQAMPPTASLNFPAGVNALANASVVGIASAGENAGAICVHTNVATDLVMDVTGWFPAGSRYVATAPARVLETRSGEAFATVDGLNVGEGMLGVSANGTSRFYELPIAGRAGVPELDVDAVFLNAVAVAPTGSGFLSVTPGPCPEEPPPTATLNFTDGVAATANGVLVGLGTTGGSVCVYANVDTHVVIDVVGYIPGGG